jgi:demethylmacrocin O-methyltransferase
VAPVVALSGSLDALARLSGTDKSSKSHGYTEHYKRYLGPRRRERLKVLEIGVQTGASLRAWRHWLPHAELYGIDLAPPPLRLPRTHLFQGDQADTAFLERVIAHVGVLDVVIDDGSHRGPDIETSFLSLFPHVRRGGLYVIEDLQTAYYPGWLGGGIGHPDTGIALLKRLIDVVQRPDSPPQSSLPSTIRAVQVHHRVAFIEAGA